MFKFYVSIMIFFLIIPAYADDGLTGRWRGSDGGIYYVTQSGNRVFWYGQDSRRRPVWSNVFSGRLRGRSIRGNWADVPKGYTEGSGTLELRIQRRGSELRVVRQTGGFSAVRLKKIRKARPSSYHRNDYDYDFDTRYDQEGSRSHRDLGGISDATTSANECIQFDTQYVGIKRLDDNWALVSRNYFLERFDRHHRRWLNSALSIIKHYGLNEFCSVGGAGTKFRYLLSNGAVPQGEYVNENCSRLHRRSLRISKSKGWWRISDRRSTLFKFTNRRDAQHAFDVINEMRFRYSCFVGETAQGYFHYFRR